MSTLSLNVTLERPDFTLRVDQPLELAGITAVFGPSGSGKTTLLRVIAGLEREARGTVAFDGETWASASAHVPTHRRRIGYVFQDGRLFAHLSVEQNLRFALQRTATSGPRASISFEAAVEALDLRALLPRRTPSLSGGEQQRVAIARALLTSPRLMLMDEPLSSLDVARKQEILPHIEKLPSTFGIPVLYVTHNVDEVARLAADVVLLAGGRIVAHDNVAAIFERSDLGAFTGGPASSRSRLGQTSTSSCCSTSTASTYVRELPATPSRSSSSPSAAKFSR
jgi:molybdate transport system ATP-binding protein